MAIPAPPLVKGAVSFGLGSLGAIGGSKLYDVAVNKLAPIQKGMENVPIMGPAIKQKNLTRDIMQKSGATRITPAEFGVPALPGTATDIYFGGKKSEIRAGREAASTLRNRSSREAAATSNAYGTRKGSALTGLGGSAPIINQKNRTLTSQGKTAKLAPTQLIRDPKTGRQVVGDLAYSGGRPVYMARASIQSRNDTPLARLSRWSGIGGQRQADAQAARGEYRTALRNTQQYTRQLGISPQAATNQRLPGYGVGTKKVGPKIVGPKKVGPKPVQGPTTSLIRPA
jgi:hypothetical protein